MVLEVECQHLWLCIIYMKTFCKTEKGLTTCAVFCDLSKAFDTLDHRYFYGSWNISMGLEVYRTSFLLVICKTDSSILLLGGIGQLPGGNYRGTPGFTSRSPTICLYVNDLPQASNLTSTLFADDTLLTLSSANSANL